MDIMYFVTICGYLLLFCILYHNLCFLWTMFRCYLLTTIGFVKDITKYGEWAVVTGATDGIGKAYARQLAQQGLKIVLISRTKSKLEKVAKEIEEEFQVETKVICFDFSQTVGYEDIEVELSGLDIGILVNNVGTVYGELVSFAESDINKVMDIVQCNVFSHVRMTHMVIKGMLTRKGGLIIHISSSVMYYDIKHLNIYPATKAFMSKLWKTLQVENTGLIHHQLVTPFVVSTNIVPVKVNFMCPSAEEYVKSAIRTIGIMEDTCGYWFHEIQKYICERFPEPVRNYFIQKMFNHTFSND